MRDAHQPGQVSLVNLVGKLREGYYVIPDFQREFEWEPTDIRELMRSIFNDYYIGSLLLWKGKDENFGALACEALYGWDGDPQPSHIVLDGQQRLTAMYYAFMAPDVDAPGRSNRYLFFIRVDRFIAGVDEEAFEYDWTSRGVRLLESPEKQFEKHMFPLSIVGKSGFALPNWLQGYEKHWDERLAEAEEAADEVAKEIAVSNRDAARQFAAHIDAIVNGYQIAFIALNQELEIDRVCDIFTQINSRGVRLDAFDLLNALLRPKGVKLKDMWREAAPQLSFVETSRMNVYILQVMSILRQAYCSPKYLYYLLPGQARKFRDPDGKFHKEVLVPDADDFKRRWKQAVEAIKRAIRLLSDPREFGAIASKHLPYVSIIPAFAAIQTAATELEETKLLDAKRKVRHWYWASVFTNRYSGSVESTAARDYQDVQAWFTDDKSEPAVIGEFRSRFGSLDLARESKRGTSVYSGIFNLLVLNGARDWLTGDAPVYDDLDDHHIVPKSWGKRHSPKTSIDSILNRTPLTSKTNRKVINDRLPSEYLPEMMEASGETIVRSVLESHFISPKALDILLREPFNADDYEEFIAERQTTIRSAIEDLLIKERLDLPPQLRELDEEIEQIELSLREHVAQLLGKDVELPSHVAHKIDERIKRAARKDATFNNDHYESLVGRLEFADLREIEDSIVNKALWPQFADLFVNKETLIGKFRQLAELRNGIRHSRHVDDVTRKEGEAALLWFQKVLARATPAKTR